jgi:hypothetical protein
MHAVPVKQLVLALVLCGALLASAAPAALATAYISPATPLTACPGTSSTCTKRITPTIASRTTVTMVCYQDAKWTDGKSHRWFYVRRGATEGFARAGNVQGQTTVPRVSLCVSSAHRDIWAANNALRYMGNTQYPSLCWKFVHDMWALAGVPGLPAGTTMTPAKAWTLVRGRHGSGSADWKRPPRGAIVFWNGRPGYPEGHSAISIGDTWLVSTGPEGRFTSGVIHFTTIGTRNADAGLNAAYLGWWKP